MTTDQLIDRRIALFFNDRNTEKPVLKDLSTAVFTSPDTLWVASDEMNAIERLKKIDEKTFGEHETFYLSKLLNDFMMLIRKSISKGWTLTENISG